MTHSSYAKYKAWLDQYHAPVGPDFEMIYMAAPYSKVEDKDAMMEAFMTFSGQWQAIHPDQHVCSPLFNHFSLNTVPDLGKDYAYWLNYSRNLLKRCDRLVVVCLPGWQDSTGVADEVRYATEMGMPIAYVSHELFQALTQTNTQPAN